MTQDKGQSFMILFLLSGVAFIWPFLTSGINIALPSIAAEFGVDAVRISWMTNITLLFTAIFLLPAGRVSAITGYRKILLSGIGIAVLSSAAVALVQSYAVLVAVRGVQGVGTALISTSGMIFLSNEFTGKRRGMAFGLYTAAVYFGLSAGPFLGGFIVRFFGWRSIFYFISLFASVIWFQALYDLPRHSGESSGDTKFDFLGSFIYSAGLILIIYSIDKIGSMFGIAAVISGVAAIVFFLFYESTLQYPLVNIRLFSGNRALSYSCLACFISYASVFAVTYLLSLYLQYVKGLSPDAAGFILVTQPLMQALVSVFSGKASEKFEPSTVASFGMLLTAVGLFFLIWIDAETGTRYIVLVSLLLGFGFALFAAPNNNAIMSSVTQEHYASVSGVVGTLRLLGQLFSMAIATTVFSVMMGHNVVRSDNIEKFISSVGISFTIMTLLCLLSALFSLSMIKTPKKRL